MVQSAQRRQALGEVEARHREILRLEADIRVRCIYILTLLYRMHMYVCMVGLYCTDTYSNTYIHQELHDMFYDMALLVEEQVSPYHTK